ncbi:PEP/pyruvate-binding domain-containing protein [Ruania zhangjianzhongii]|uniref:PEP/pyruvate-binding domain-containing protein n=1 Tax=Ruania zhangjianzhongii TaxID=2603206 RepID=UPI0011CB4CA6|nr:PEP/pyruvate-binding domain-containing protein [Ruania zhangjianzhongii]
MITPLLSATTATCGGKAGALAALLRAGLPVPRAFVVPFAAHEAHAVDARALSGALRSKLAEALTALGDPQVAVRSSAAHEDTAEASAAGQYESVLAVRGAAEVDAAIRRCWAAARETQVAEYWRQLTGEAPEDPDIAVIVQQLVDADASGVMFTPATTGGATRIEASWGLGPSVVGGTVTPDTWQIGPDGTARPALGHKTTRVDRRPGRGGLAVSEVPAHRQDVPAIDEASAGKLAALGRQAATILGGPQDIEWAIAGGRIWILQSRPITAPAPPLPHHDRAAGGPTLTGTPGAHGRLTAPARVLRSTSELSHLQHGDILVCRYTDPSWTPAFRIATGIVTETGGALSHAAIVAREHQIPAVIGVPDATTAIRDGQIITIDGTRGTVTPS